MKTSDTLTDLARFQYHEVSIVVIIMWIFCSAVASLHRPRSYQLFLYSVSSSTSTWCWSYRSRLGSGSVFGWLSVSEQFFCKRYCMNRYWTNARNCGFAACCCGAGLSLTSKLWVCLSFFFGHRPKRFWNDRINLDRNVWSFRLKNTVTASFNRTVTKMPECFSGENVSAQKWPECLCKKNRLTGVCGC